MRGALYAIRGGLLYLHLHKNIEMTASRETMGYRKRTLQSKLYVEKGQTIQ